MRWGKTPKIGGISPEKMFVKSVIKSGEQDNID